MVEPTHLKNISQNGNLPQIGVIFFWKPPSSERLFVGENLSDVMFFLLGLSDEHFEH